MREEVFKVRAPGRKKIEKGVRQNDADRKYEQLPLPVRKGSCKLVDAFRLRAKVRDEEDTGTNNAEEAHTPVNPVLGVKLGLLSRSVRIHLHHFTFVILMLSGMWAVDPRLWDTRPPQ